MKTVFTVLFLIASFAGNSQIYCIMVDQNNLPSEYLGTYDVSTGTMAQISSSRVSAFLNNGTNPIIDPVNRKYIYLTSNPGPVKIIDLDNGQVVSTFQYNTGFFPRHFVYNCNDSTIYCIMVDQNNSWNEYLGKYDISTGTMTQISASPVSGFVNNGTNPIIDPVNRKYIYLTNNPGPVKIIDLDNGQVVSTFQYDSGFFPRHFAYNCKNATIYCIMVDQNNSWNEYLGTYDISTGTMKRISTSPVSTLVNNGSSPIIDPINKKFIYLTYNSGPVVKIIDLDNGNVVSAFQYNSGFFPRHFASQYLCKVTITDTVCNSYSSPSGKYIWTKSGTYSDTFTNSFLCDSVITVKLTIKNNSSALLTPTVCDHYRSPSGIYYWTNSGTYFDTLTNSYGCDSVITVNLIVKNNSYASISSTHCDNYYSPSGKYSWSHTGIYKDTLLNKAGCDSVITIDLTIYNSSFSTISPIVCDNFESPSGHHIWNVSDTYRDTILNSHGCDSIIIINLSIMNPLTDFSFDSNKCNTVINFTSQSVYANTFLWDFGDGSKSTDSNPIHIYNVPGKYLVQLNTTYDKKCLDSIAYFVDVQDIENNINIPNIFTPNNDGINDVFKVTGKYTDCIKFQLLVFNRWGQTIFDSGQKGEDTVWDGFYKGEKVSPGVYFFILLGEKFEKCGTVTVIY
jgi:gliding motility-associated-like protein